MEVEKEHRLREMAGHEAGSTSELKAALEARLQQRYAGGRGVNTSFSTAATQTIRRQRPNRPEVFAMDVDDDDDDNMDVDSDNELNTDLTVAINKQEENAANKKSKIVQNVAQDLSHNVPQLLPFLLSSTLSSAMFAAPSSTPGAASSSSSTVQNMIVAIPDGVKRGKGRSSKKPPTIPMIVDNEEDGQKRSPSDNDDNSGKPKKTQRKGGDPSFTKKENCPACSD